MSTAYSVPQPAAPNAFLPPPDLVKKRRKLASRVLPDAVIREYRENGQPDADLYEQLVERERKLDWITQRKRIELQDGLQKVIKVSCNIFFLVYLELSENKPDRLDEHCASLFLIQPPTSHGKLPRPPRLQILRPEREFQAGRLESKGVFLIPTRPTPGQSLKQPLAPPLPNFLPF